MSFKDNYFGGFNSWTDMAEFRKYEADVPSWGDAMQQKYRPGKVSVARENRCSLC
jgi:hypothetical protein